MPAVGAAEAVEFWSLTTLREKFIKIDVKVVCHGRYITIARQDRCVRRAPGYVFGARKGHRSGS